MPHFLASHDLPYRIPSTGLSRRGSVRVVEQSHAAVYQIPAAHASIRLGYIFRRLACAPIFRFPVANPTSLPHLIDMACFVREREDHRRTCDGFVSLCLSSLPNWNLRCFSCLRLGVQQSSSSAAGLDPPPMNRVVPHLHSIRSRPHRDLVIPDALEFDPHSESM